MPRLSSVRSGPGKNAVLSFSAVRKELRVDGGTGAIIVKLGTPGYSGSLTGFINFSTEELHLRENSGREKVARAARGQSKEAGKIVLKPGWFAFDLTCDKGELQISPASSHGAIPIQSARLFETSLKRLFSKRAEGRVRLLFYDLRYQRTIPDNQLAQLALVIGDNPVAASLSDKALLRLLALDHG